MSFQITTAFVQQYGSNVYMLAQQKKSRLFGTVMLESGIVGKSAYIDQFGIGSGQVVTNRHGDTPLNSTPFARRKLDIVDWDTADLTDNFDRIKTLINPDNAIVQAQAASAGRFVDDLIIGKFFADASTGETGSTTTSFPAANQVAVNSWAYGTGTGNAGLTISKLIEARQKLEANDAIEDGDEVYIAVGSKQKANLLATTEATSEDYASVKALVRGEIDTFMGFKFIRSERLLLDGSSYRRVPVWVKNGMCLGVSGEIQSSIDKRPDKRNSMQAYTKLSMGATRLEETKVVEIKCAE